jgi:FkbM family methyltransferase
MDRILGLLRSLVIYHNPVSLRAWRRFYAAELSPGDLVFDVGAHMGSRARAMRAAGARVIALEPQPDFARFLRLTLPRDILVLEAAAGPDETETETEMAVSSRHPTVSSLRPDFVGGAAAAPGFEHVRWDARARVRMVTLDRLIAQHGTPVHVKIDVEGFEAEVLAGLSRPVASISVEYLPAFPHLARAAVDRIAGIGDYAFNAVAGETATFAWERWRSPAETLDWLAALPPTATSGDLFARRRTAATGPRGAA